MDIEESIYALIILSSSLTIYELPIPSWPLNLEFPRIQLVNIRTFSHSIKHKLRHKLACSRTVLDTPACMPRGDEQARYTRPAN